MTSKQTLTIDSRTISVFSDNILLSRTFKQQAEQITIKYYNQLELQLKTILSRGGQTTDLNIINIVEIICLVIFYLFLTPVQSQSETFKSAVQRARSWRKLQEIQFQLPKLSSQQQRDCSPWPITHL